MQFEKEMEAAAGALETVNGARLEMRCAKESLEKVSARHRQAEQALVDAERVYVAAVEALRSAR